MKNVSAIGACVVIGVLAFKLGKRLGHMEGVVDVLSENNMDSFTKEYKNGYSVTIAKSKKKGE